MPKRRAVLVGVALTTVAILGQLRPTPHRIPGRRPLNLEQDVPAEFGAWRQDTGIAPLQPSPDVEAKLQQLYSQQLSRTYRNADGQRVMLLIAYGEDQLELTTQVHLPSVCYPAQGFDIIQQFETRLPIGGGTLPVVRMVARAPGRNEPITYWITMADMVIQNETQRRVARVRYALRGLIPDGMLVRISTIDTDVERAFTIQTNFLRELQAAIQPSITARIYGDGIHRLS